MLLFALSPSPLPTLPCQCSSRSHSPSPDFPLVCLPTHVHLCIHAIPTCSPTQSQVLLLTCHLQLCPLVELYPWNRVRPAWSQPTALSDLGALFVGKWLVCVIPCYMDLSLMAGPGWEGSHHVAMEAMVWEKRASATAREVLSDPGCSSAGSLAEGITCCQHSRNTSFRTRRELRHH